MMTHTLQEQDVTNKVHIYLILMYIKQRKKNNVVFNMISVAVQMLLELTQISSAFNNRILTVI